MPSLCILVLQFYNNYNWKETGLFFLACGFPLLSLCQWRQDEHSRISLSQQHLPGLLFSLFSVSSVPVKPSCSNLICAELGREKRSQMCLCCKLRTSVSYLGLQGGRSKAVAFVCQIWQRAQLSPLLEEFTNRKDELKLQHLGQDPDFKYNPQNCTDTPQNTK